MAVSPWVVHQTQLFFLQLLESPITVWFADRRILSISLHRMRKTAESTPHRNVRCGRYWSLWINPKNSLPVEVLLYKIPLQAPSN